MKITIKNGCDFRPKDGDFSTTTLIELSPSQSAKRIPSNIVFLIDNSSSMGGSKWNTVKESVTELLDSLSNDDRVAVVLFDAKASTLFPLASLAENRVAMKTALQKLDNPSGVTNLEEGIKEAFKVFEARSDQDKIKRVNHVILLTDGFPTDHQGYRVSNMQVYEGLVRNSESVTLTGIGIGTADEYDSEFIGRISDLGRGAYYHANDLTKFKMGLRAEIQRLQSAVAGDCVLKFRNVSAKIMRIAKVAPEIVIYDVPGNSEEFEIPTGTLTKDLTAFLVQTLTTGDGSVGTELKLFEVFAEADGEATEVVEAKIMTSEKQADLLQLDPDTFRANQALQVNLNGEQIRLSLAAGNKEKATRIIQNTALISGQLGQKNVTRALTQLIIDIKAGKSGADELATIKDESKKTRLLIS